MHRILVIDDDEDMRSLMITVLRDYTVLQAANGEEGLEVFRSESPDLVITDLCLPAQEGIQTIAELRREVHVPKIIAMSGGGQCGDGDYLSMAEELGVERTLPKPFRPHELLRAVEEVLEQ
jgi:DNA-binding response OmpR family regulator